MTAPSVPYTFVPGDGGERRTIIGPANWPTPQELSRHGACIEVGVVLPGMGVVNYFIRVMVLYIYLIRKIINVKQYNRRRYSGAAAASTPSPDFNLNFLLF